MINLIHGDCMEYINGLKDNSFDICITDPVYGIGFKYNSYDDTFDNWKKLMSKFIPEAIRTCGTLIMPSCHDKAERWLFNNFNHKWRICWYKGSTGHASAIGFCDWEMLMVYGNPKKKFIHDYFYAQPRPRQDCKIDHPCPKPIKYYSWLMDKFVDNDHKILDPFMGSGTGAIASHNYGLDFVGIELDKDYFDAAVKRFNQHKSQLRMF